MSGLRNIRLGASLTQKALASRAGLTENTIQKLEYGTVLPSVDTMYRLWKVLGDPVFEWLNDLFEEFQLAEADGHLRVQRRGRPRSGTPAATETEDK